MATTIPLTTPKIDLEDYLNRNEAGDAELLEKNFVGQLRYDPLEKAWYIWRGAYWVKDTAGEIYRFLDMVASAYLVAASDARARGNKDLSERYAKRTSLLLTNNRMKNVLDIASRLPGLVFNNANWDANPMKLPVANGIVNLLDGKLYTSRPEDNIREYCPIDWKDLKEPAPLWEKTLEEIFYNKQDVNHELIPFIARCFGYGITGETKEQKLPILSGEGSNGKSLMMDIIMEVLGDSFCFNVQSEVLMELRQGDPNGAKPFVVALRNKRFVFASESKEGQNLNTGLVKQLTGDGFITARTLHKEPVTFKQTHKIFLVTNHLPNIPNSEDYAIWRRVIRIPFEVCFKENPDSNNPNERLLDPDLIKKLRSEYSGILAWLVRGCLDWQKQGLNPPDVVTKSTKDYQKAEDLVSQFLTECIERDPNQLITASALYLHFVDWCESTGDKPVNNKNFSQKVAKEYGKAVSKRYAGKVQKVYDGIKLKV